METEKWSQNTDVNTFRGYIEEKQQGEELIEQIKQIQTGEQNSFKALTDSSKGIFTSLENKFKTDSEQLMFALKRSFNFLSDPFEKFIKTQSGKEYADFGQFLFCFCSTRKRFRKIKLRFQRTYKWYRCVRSLLLTQLEQLHLKSLLYSIFLLVLFRLSMVFLENYLSLLVVYLVLVKEQKEREKLEKEHLDTQKALAEKEAEIAKQEKLEGINQKLVDPLPLPVTMGDSSSVVPSQDQSKQFKGIEMPDGSMSLDEPTEAKILEVKNL